jgi:putative transposase
MGATAKLGIVTVTGSGGRPDPAPGWRNEEAARPTLSPSFPAELIRHAVWLYHVFSLSFRDVELLLAERGIFVSYESIRRWCLKFGASFANNLRRRRPAR